MISNVLPKIIPEECTHFNLFHYLFFRSLLHEAYLIFPAKKDEHHLGAHPLSTDSVLICQAALGLLVKVRGNNFNVKH